MDGPLVLIEWVDACGCSTDWREIAKLKEDKPMICKSVGWLTDQDVDNREFVTIVPHVTPGDHERAEEHGCGDMTIPRRAILKVTHLNANLDVVPKEE